MADFPVAIPDTSPWWVLPEEMSALYTQELRSEVGPAHPLHPMLDTLAVIAKCDASDDVVVQSRGDPHRYFVVHLTWSGKIDQMPDRFPGWGEVGLAELAALVAED